MSCTFCLCMDKGFICLHILRVWWPGSFVVVVCGAALGVDQAAS